MSNLTCIMRPYSPQHAFMGHSIPALAAPIHCWPEPGGTPMHVRCLSVIPKPQVAVHGDQSLHGPQPFTCSKEHAFIGHSTPKRASPLHLLPEPGGTPMHTRFLSVIPKPQVAVHGDQSLHGPQPSSGPEVTQCTSINYMYTACKTFQ